MAKKYFALTKNGYEGQYIIFDDMLLQDLPNLIVEQKTIASLFLKRFVLFDLYLPKHIPDATKLSLLLINDGQNLEEMNFASMLEEHMASHQIDPLLCVGIHAGNDRKQEYGTAGVLDFEGRGAMSDAYHQFILQELLPFLQKQYAIEQFSQKAFAGFSLGGLSALDVTWKHPDIFSMAGVFSGSLWWRTKSLEAGYQEETDRIMHQLIRKGSYKPGFRFYFTTGSLDEKADRNNNGVIDSIDDTLALILELKRIGYQEDHDIFYLNDEQGKHDVATWGRSMPGFLLWGWGRRGRRKS